MVINLALILIIRELDNVPELEKQEMIDIYTKKGISQEDATEIVNLLFPSKEAFLDIMMIEELGILPKEGFHTIQFSSSMKRKEQLGKELLLLFQHSSFWEESQCFLISLAATTQSRQEKMLYSGPPSFFSPFVYLF